MTLNADEFLGMTVEGSNATQVELVPEGEYKAQIAVDGIGLAHFKYKQGEREGQTGYRMTVKWELEDPDGALKEQLGRAPTITQSIMLDLTPEGGLDMGKGRNVYLGQLRDAVNQNADGKPWQPSMLVGEQATILVKHRTGQDGQLQQDVNRVAPYSS